MFRYPDGNYSTDFREWGIRWKVLTIYENGSDSINQGVALSHSAKDWLSLLIQSSDSVFHIPLPPSTHQCMCDVIARQCVYVQNFIKLINKKHMESVNIKCFFGILMMCYTYIIWMWLIWHESGLYCGRHLQSVHGGFNVLVFLSLVCDVLHLSTV